MPRFFVRVTSSHWGKAIKKMCKLCDEMGARIAYGEVPFGTKLTFHHGNPIFILRFLYISCYYSRGRRWHRCGVGCQFELASLVSCGY